MGWPATFGFGMSTELPGAKRARASPKHALCHAWAWPVAHQAVMAQPV
jgi:hypothetical protein